MDESILQKTMDRFGVSDQMEKLIEESAELIVAVKHYKDGRSPIEDVIEEMADVTIVIEQFRLIYGPEIDAFISAKMSRLKAMHG